MNTLRGKGEGNYFVVVIFFLVKVILSGKYTHTVSYFEKCMPLYCPNNDISRIQLEFKVKICTD